MSRGPDRHAGCMRVEGGEPKIHPPRHAGCTRVEVGASALVSPTRSALRPIVARSPGAPPFRQMLLLTVDRRGCDTLAGGGWGRRPKGGRHRSLSFRSPPLSEGRLSSWPPRWTHCQQLAEMEKRGSRARQRGVFGRALNTASLLPFPNLLAPAFVHTHTHTKASPARTGSKSSDNGPAEHRSSSRLATRFRKRAMSVAGLLATGLRPQD